MGAKIYNLKVAITGEIQAKPLKTLRVNTSFWAMIEVESAISKVDPAVLSHMVIIICVVTELPGYKHTTWHRLKSISHRASP